MDKELLERYKKQNPKKYEEKFGKTIAEVTTEIPVLEEAQTDTPTVQESKPAKVSKKV